MARAQTRLSKLGRTRAGRYSAISVGVVLLAAAPIVGPPAPGPLGIIMIAAGLTLILRSSATARRRYVRFKRRHPKTGKWVDIGLRRHKRERGPDGKAAPEGLEPVPTGS